MTEYWQSQARKFCDFCKCWIADQRASIEFHENGKRHQQAVKDRLRDIGQKGKRDEKKTVKEEQWLKQMEQQAMKDYRSKDLQENSDLTAKIFNEKRGERETHRESIYNPGASNQKEGGFKEQYQSKTELNSQPKDGKEIAGLKKPGPPSWGAPTKTSVVDSHRSSNNPFQQRISAKTHGTKYHNPRPETNWREAKTEDGNTYYWNITSHVSIWEPPAEGYVSIKEQEEEFERANKIENMKVKEEQKRIDTRKLEKNQVISHGPVAKHDPYGSWQTVSENQQADTDRSTKANPIESRDVKAAESSNVALPNDKRKKFEVDSKKTPSLGDDKEFEVDFAAGITPTSQSKNPGISGMVKGTKQVETSKPGIVFRKRKINPDHRKVARRREDGE